VSRTDAELNEFRRRLAARRAAGYRVFFGPVTGACLPAIAAVAGPGVGKVALDVGSGAGHLAAALRRQGYRCVAADRSIEMMCDADAAVPPHGVVADAQALPFATGSVDLVCAAFLLSHVDELDALLGEFARVLRPGGRVVLANWCDPAESPFNGLLVAVLRRHGRHAALDRSLALADPEHVSQHLNAATFTGGAVERVRTTVVLNSARDWLDGLLAGSSGLAAALSSLDAPTRESVRHEFLAAAEPYARNGRIAVDAAAYVLSASV
jgi:SAM-dependent methyltransferase